MLRTRSAALLLATLALASACAPKTIPYDPFKVPRDRFYGSLRTVAIAPMRAPKDLENAGIVKEQFTGIVVARMRAAGLAVVPPEQVGPVLEAAVAAQGGIYDPATGNLVEEKAKAAKVEATKVLKERHGADALLRVDLRVVMARLDHDVASWDGVTEAAGTGFWKHFLVGSHSGRIPAPRPPARKRAGLRAARSARPAALTDRGPLRSAPPARPLTEQSGHPPEAPSRVFSRAVK